MENHCAALCTAMEHSCSGFYIDSTEVPYHGSCHLVDETINNSPTVGHGWRWLDVSWVRGHSQMTSEEWGRRWLAKF